MKYDQGDSIEFAGVVFKTSNTGLAHNERFLVLKEGFLYYYSQVPKNYKEGATDIRSSFIQSMPKHSVSVAHINMIKGDLKAPAEFTVEFQHKHLMGDKEIRQSINSSNFNFQPKNMNDKEIVSWKFKVGGKEIRDQWIVMIKSSREKEIKEKVMIETVFNSYGYGGGEGSGNGQDFRKSFIPWKETYEDQKEQVINFRKKNKEQQKKKEQQKLKKAEKQKQQKRQKEERQKQEMMDRLKQEARLSLEKQIRQQQIKRQKEEKERREKEERQRQERERQREEQERIERQRKEEKILQRQREERQKESKDKEGQQRQQSSQYYSTEKQKQLLLQQQNLNLQQQADKEKLAQYFYKSPSVSKPLTPSNLRDINNNSLIQQQGNIQENYNLIVNQNNQYRNHEESFVTEFKMSNSRNNHDFSKMSQSNLNRIKTQPKLSSVDGYLSRSKRSKVDSFKNQSIISIAREDYQNTKPNFSTEYYSLLANIHSGTFQDRLDTQIKLYAIISKFRDVAAYTFKELVDEQTIDFSKSNTYQSEVESIIFTIGTCQLQQQPGKKGTTQYNYDQSKIKQVTRLFRGYQNIIGRLMKYSRHNNIGLVIPLVALIEYKGVVALAAHNNSEYQAAISRIQLENLSEAMKSLGIIQNKLQIKQHKSQKFYIIYVKQPVPPSAPKSQTLSFDFPLDSEFLYKATQNNCSVSLAHLQKYRELLISTKLTPQTRDIIEGLSYCIFLKYLRKIYRSSQGELNETSFWNLLLKKDTQLLKLITNIGCHYIPQFKGVLLNYIRYYFGIDIELETNTNIFSGQFPVKSVIINPKTKVIKFQETELQETLNLFDTHISKNKFQLAKEVIYLAETVYGNSPFSKDDLNHTLYKKALVLNLQCSYLPSSELLESLITQFKSHSTFKLKLCFLLIKNYSQLQYDKIFPLFRNTIDFISINYGENHYELITLNCIMAHYCAYKNKDADNARKFYQLALMLAQNYYEGGSVEIVEILVDIGRMYGHLGNHEEAQKYLNVVNKMMKDMTIANVQDGKKVKLGISVATILMELGKTNEAIIKLKEVEGICTEIVQLYELLTLQYHLLIRSNNHVPILPLLHKLFCISTNSKTLKSTFSLAISFTVSFSLTRTQQQRLILITDKMFVDGDSNHIQLIKEKMNSNGFGQYVMRVIKGLCDVNLQEEGYEELLNRYENIVGVVGKQWIVGLVQSKTSESGSNYNASKPQSRMLHV